MEEVKEAIAKAIRFTLAEIGMEKFKKTSFFVSNVVKKKGKK